MAEPFKPGDRVTCYHADRHWLQEGRTYTVHETMTETRLGVQLIGLEEVLREGHLWGCWRFRP